MYKFRTKKYHYNARGMYRTGQFVHLEMYREILICSVLISFWCVFHWSRFPSHIFTVIIHWKYGGQSSDERRESRRGGDKTAANSETNTLNKYTYTSLHMP